MSDFAALQSLKNSLIRKALNGSAFIADSSADTIDELTLFDGETGDITSLPAGYADLGYMQDAGIAFARAITEQAITSWQSVSATRSDRTADVPTAVLLAQETKLATIGLYTGVDTSGVEALSNGVVRIDMPATPANRLYRLLGVFADQTDEGEIIVCRYFPNAKVTDVANQSYDKGDEVVWPVTLTGFVDETVGTAESHIFGGAGWLAKLADMGFTAAEATVPTISGASTLALGTAGGTLVEINGRGFTGTVVTTGVKFAGTNATAWHVVSDSVIVAEAPAHSAGSGPIVVTNAVGASTDGPTVVYS